MSDPLEELARFRSEAGGAPMPAPAEIRRRGDRMRRRGNIVKAGLAALAIAAVVVPLALREAGGHDDSHVADNSHTRTPSALSEANLVTSSDVTFMKGAESFTQTYSGAPDVQSPFSVCAAEPLPALGTTAAVQRDFTAHSDETGDAADTYLNESIGEFSSPDAAATAAATLKGWYTHCSPTGSTSYTTVRSWQDVSTGTPATASQMIAVYGPADANPGTSYDVSGRTDLRWYVDVSIIVAGDRVAVLTQNALMRDYDTTAITTTGDDVPVAARRLAGSAPAGSQPPATTTAGTSGSGPSHYPATTIPAGFPLDSGWRDDQPEGPDSRLAPSRTRPVDEFSACGTTLPWPAYEDRLSAAFHNPEDSRDAILTTYRDAGAAAAATKALVDLYRGCPSENTQPPGYVAHTTVTRTGTSGDSWQVATYLTYNGDPALSITDTEVIRVGLGVLILTHNNEGDRASLSRDLHSMESEGADSIAAMCAFTEAGC